MADKVFIRFQKTKMILALHLPECLLLLKGRNIYLHRNSHHFVLFQTNGHVQLTFIPTVKSWESI